jgi:hypothetical protein
MTQLAADRQHGGPTHLDEQRPVRLGGRAAWSRFKVGAAAAVILAAAEAQGQREDGSADAGVLGAGTVPGAPV